MSTRPQPSQPSPKEQPSWLARLNPLHFQALMDTETAKARALKAH